MAVPEKVSDQSPHFLKGAWHGCADRALILSPTGADALLTYMDRESLREVLQEFQAEREEELKKIFTDAQWTAYEKWKEENPPRRGRRGGGE